MTDQKRPRNARIFLRSTRIVTGLILLLFVSTHLMNASLGIVSINAMDNARPYLMGLWDIPPLGLVLALSLLVHFCLGLWSVYERPTFRTNSQDIVQIATALVAVPIMATHVIGISMTANAGLHIDYAAAIKLMWIDNPSIGLLQIIVVTVVWLHGCAGLLIWLRSIERARNLILWIYPVAIAIPVLALLGFSEAGRDVLDGTYEVVPQQRSYDDPAPEVNFALIKSITSGVIWGSLVLAALTLVARAIRLRLQSGARFTPVRDGQLLASSASGLSLLDAFQEQNELHANLCQGRGRCGTCAVRVVSSEFPVPEPTELERRTLAKKNLPEDARLACQLKPSGGAISVVALFPADYTYLSLDDDPVSEHREEPA